MVIFIAWIAFIISKQKTNFNHIKEYMKIKIFVTSWCLLMTLKYYNLINTKNLIKHHSLFMQIWWWSWWWWIVFVVWLTDERRLALFPAGTIVRDPHHLESPSRVWTCAEPEFKLSWMKLRSCDNHYTTAPKNWWMQK